VLRIRFVRGGGEHETSVRLVESPNQVVQRGGE